MTTSYSFSAGGRTGEFRYTPGVVIGTDQRSDSHVSGGGRTFVLDGTGGGASQVSTRVVVKRDIWLRDSQGEEQHVRVLQDVPVRVGQQIALIYYWGAGPKSKQVSDRLVSIFNISTNQSYAIGSPSTVTALMDPKNHKKPNPNILAAWAVSLVLCVAGVGFLGVFALLVRYYFVSRKQKVVTAEVAAAVERAHQVVLDTLYAEQSKLVVQAERADPARLQNGPAV